MSWDGSTMAPWVVRGLLLVATSGPLSHYCLWARIIVDDYAEILFVSFLLLQPSLVLLISHFGHISMLSAYILSFFLQALYSVTLAISISVYRLFFHPTRHYPGPFWARLSVWWKVKAFADNDTKCYIVFDNLHKRYGDIVRIGPRQLSINHVDAISAVYGRSSKTSRWANADLLRDGNIMCLRDKAAHARRRVAWDQALGSRACQSYLPRVTRLVDAWIDAVRKSEGQPISITDWVQMLVFDISGDSGWSQSYGQIESGEIDPAIAILHKDLKSAIYAIQVAWLVNIVRLFPGFSAHDPSKPLKDHCARMLAERKENLREAEVDVLSYLEKGDSIAEETILISDLRLFTLGASDTTFSAIVFCLYWLIQYPELQPKLREEALPIFEDEQRIWAKLQALPLLDSIIQETLRMNPPVPQGLVRELPATEDAMMGPYHVPAGTQVSCPTWSLHHDQRYWDKPNEWVPERWTTRPEMITDRRAFVPFGSTGPMMCAGKYFAMQEMKVFLAKLVMAFDFRFEKGDDGNRLLTESKDCFTVALPDQTMIFEARKRV